MTASDDPFEEAARREHDDRLRREARIASVRGGARQRGARERDGGGTGVAIVVFLGPYLLWAALRAGNHAWTTPTVGKAVVSFFFGTGIPFAVYTGWMLFLVWAWAIVVASSHRPPRTRLPRPVLAVRLQNQIPLPNGPCLLQRLPTERLRWRAWPAGIRQAPKRTWTHVLDQGIAQFCTRGTDSAAIKKGFP